MTIALTIGFIIWTLLDGYCQAYYYDLYPSEKKHRNLHPFYVAERVIILTAIWFLIPTRYPLWDCIIFILSLCLIYSFVHNGIYYWTRHKLNDKVYPKTWRDDSEKSTAFFELGFGYRTAMFLIGLLFITGVILEN